MKLSEIHIRDPFILPFDGKYYLFGTAGKYAWEGNGGFYCNISEDLENWSEPIKCFEPPKENCFLHCINLTLPMEWKEHRS